MGCSPSRSATAWLNSANAATYRRDTVASSPINRPRTSPAITRTPLRRPVRRSYDAPPRRRRGRSLVWGMVADGYRADRWDVNGALIRLAGMAVIMWAPRGR
ncbi:hypothetical protein ALMP_61030 [Streptomyces sp. A012304]|nr:hypothetical protein ALMP_61030 [Streptomyces sp. A012304]